MGAGTSPAEPEFFCVLPQDDLSETSQRPIFTKFWPWCPVDVSGNTFSKILTLWVIFPQNLKSKVGQTGTTLRAGYRSRDALQTHSCLLLVVVQGPGSFRLW